FWDINKMWGDMCLRRPGEGTVAYVESHDQALVGDQTMIFRLAGANMYTDMEKTTHNPVIDRAIALHKMIRLFTMAGGGESYLNFMGNEFGHPEWIDFPREGNGWSFHYCRRQWSLKNNEKLKYVWLNDFDHDMLAVTKASKIFNQRMANLQLMKAPEQMLCFARTDLFFVFNFHSTNSLNNVLIPVYPDTKELTVMMSSDDYKYGGFGNVAHQTYEVKEFDGVRYVELYIPARTAIILKETKEQPKAVETPVATEAPAAVEETVNPNEAPAETAAPAAEAPKKTTRKRTTKKAEAAEGEEAPKKTRKPRTKKAEAAEGEEAPKPARKPRAKKTEAAEGEEAPKKTTRKRTTKKAAEPAPVEE
ncbi:MAG: alpha amylase C-terminal domain-containing protein, partial [Oscillospiraceae bacterium]|nr:alpha amylase C-terminal domain-containing protein [Oscillospiraceae bacterium]